MSLQSEVMTAMKEAMKSKDSVALESLRAIKSAILLAQTESGASEELTEEQELKILQKLVKQRKDSATIFTEQGRNDLAEPELAQAAVIEKVLARTFDARRDRKSRGSCYRPNRRRRHERHGQSDGIGYQGIGRTSRW